jgi:dTDP-4-amino-4,6-dideoxygalactose transaminase
MSELALLGGSPAVTVPRPHEVWPPQAGESELKALAGQRNEDISIRGRTGPIAVFENEFLDFLEGQRRYAVTFNSGTSALLAAYVAVGATSGTEVIGPALTYHAALSPAYFLGSEVVLVDIERESRAIDPTLIEAAITERTRVITVVHQWGHPAEMDAILAIASKHNLRVIEDCSHAHGSRYKGRLCGTFGDVAVFSLQANKAVFAGEGGVLVTNDASLHDRAVLTGHYRDRSRENVETPDLKSYWVTGFGPKLRMSPFNAIVATHSLAQLPRIIEGRARCLGYFRDRLREEVGYIEAPFTSPDAVMGAWYGFKPLFLEDRLPGVTKTRLIEALRAEGMEVSDPSGPPLATLPLYQNAEDRMTGTKRRHLNDPTAFSVSEFVAAQGLSLPTFYDWAQHKLLIDQYMDAFIKVERNAGKLRDGE